jgi:hypothetical protein
MTLRGFDLILVFYYLNIIGHVSALVACRWRYCGALLKAFRPTLR